MNCNGLGLRNAGILGVYCLHFTSPTCMSCRFPELLSTANPIMGS